jgi:transmembrane 9 superfamily protein 2/4
VIIIFYTLFGFFGGYVSSRIYKFFHGESWKLCFFYTPVALPGIVFATFFLLNLFVWGRGASGAVPFTTMLVVVIIWFVISVPLSVAGSWLGFKQAVIEAPVRTNQIPRQIPPVGGYLRPVPSMALAGVLPFGAIFVELYFIMNSIWFSKVYYMFGFLFVCFGLMIMTSAAVTVLMIYFLLCAEDYHWQWRSFFTAGASAFYVFASCLLYWIKDVSFLSWTSGVVYLGYSALLSLLVFILTGKPPCTCRRIPLFTDFSFPQVPSASSRVGCLRSTSTNLSRWTERAHRAVTWVRRRWTIGPWESVFSFLHSTHGVC